MIAITNRPTIFAVSALIASTLATTGCSSSAGSPYGDDLDFELVVTNSANLPAADATSVEIKTGDWACAVAAPRPASTTGPAQKKYCDANGQPVLCDAEDLYRGFSVFIHEFAHSIHLIGLRSSGPTFESRLTQAYETAMASGLWQNTYSATNRLEYWAEGVAIWFNAHWSSLDHPSVINTREKLAQYDDGLYRLVRDYFTEDTLPMCAPDAP